MRSQLLLIPLVAGLIAASGCPPSGGSNAPPFADDFFTLTGSAELLPVQLVVGPGLTLADAVAQANAIGCGVEILLSGSLVGDVVLTPRCLDPEALGIRIRGPAQLTGGIQVSCQGADCAWASAENLSVVSVDTDAFDTTYEGKLVVINASAVVQGTYSNVLTTHHTSRMVALNVFGEALGQGVAPPIAITADSSLTLLSDGTFLSASAAGDEVLHLGGNNGGVVSATVIGPTLDCRTASQHAIDFEPGNLGTIYLTSALLQPTCPVDLQLNRAGETAVWHSNNDALSWIDLGSTAGTNSRVDLRRDWRAAVVVVDLTVPIPAWVDGVGATRVRVSP